MQRDAGRGNQSLSDTFMEKASWKKVKSRFYQQAQKLYRCKDDQRGFTLIELIVTILIMSIVMVAAAGFIITAANSYRVANIEVELQSEAQIAMNQFNDILIEAKEYNFTQADGTPKLTVVTPGNTYYFILDSTKNELLFSKKPDEVDQPLLARYCKSFDVEKVGEDNKLVIVTIHFEYAGRTYTTTSCISLRNQ